MKFLEEIKQMLKQAVQLNLETAAMQKQAEEAAVVRQKELQEDLAANQKKLEAELAARKKELQEELAVSQKKLEAELAARQKKFDEEMAARQKKFDEEMAARQKKLDEEMAVRKKETDEAAKAREKDIKELRRSIGDISHSFGDVHEEHFFRSLEACLQLDDYLHFNEIYRNVSGANHLVELDIVLLNETSVAVIEVKTKAHWYEVNELAKSKVAEAKRLYPGKEEVYFGIAVMVSNTALEEYAYKKGIFLLVQKGDHVVIANKDVKPL